jgi:rubrerythrin
MAEQADCDGLTEVASTFRALSHGKNAFSSLFLNLFLLAGFTCFVFIEGESSQATGTLEFFLEVGDPATDKPFGDAVSNLEAALVSEEIEANQIFPVFAEQAREEGLEDLAAWFDRLASNQQNHVVALRQRLNELQERQ